MAEALQNAGELVRRAIELLDDASAPADIGAHLDMALSRMAEVAGVAADQIGNVAEIDSR